jgi:hypothetical protein
MAIVYNTRYDYKNADASPSPYPPKTLLQMENNANVWVVDYYGKLWWFKTASSFEKLGFKWSDIQIVPESVLASLDYQNARMITDSSIPPFTASDKQSSSKFITGWINYAPPNNYEQWRSSGTSINKAVNTEGAANCASDSFNVTKGQPIAFSFDIKKNSGSLPRFLIIDAGWTDAIEVPIKEGANNINVTSKWTGLAAFRLVCDEGIKCDFSLSFSNNGNKKYIWILGGVLIAGILYWKFIRK